MTESRIRRAVHFVPGANSAQRRGKTPSGSMYFAQVCSTSGQ